MREGMLIVKVQRMCSEILLMLMLWLVANLFFGAVNKWRETRTQRRKS